MNGSGAGSGAGGAAAGAGAGPGGDRARSDRDKDRTRDGGGAGSGAGGGAAGMGAGPGGDRMGPNGPGGRVGARQNGPRDFNSMASGNEDLSSIREKNRLDVNNNRAYRDYAGADDSPLDTLGKMIARAFGFQEMNPYDQSRPNSLAGNAPSNTGEANWSFDPLGFGAGVAGLAGGPIGTFVSLAYRGLTSLYGKPLVEIGLDRGTNRPSSAQPGIHADSGRGSEVVGIDSGKNRAVSPASPRGTPPAQVASPTVPPPVASELLTGVTGRNRNYRTLLSGESTASIL